MRRNWSWSISKCYKALRWTKVNAAMIVNDSLNILKGYRYIDGKEVLIWERQYAKHFFPMLCWTPTASVKWYSMDEYQLSMRHNLSLIHIYRGGLWLWCSACKQFFHSSVYVPTWWSNLPIVDENQLSAFPQYLDALSTRIDKHINQLISNKKHLVLPAK